MPKARVAVGLTFALFVFNAACGGFGLAGGGPFPECNGWVVNVPTTVRVGERRDASLEATLNGESGKCVVFGDVDVTWASSSPAVLKITDIVRMGANLEGVSPGVARVDVVVKHERKELATVSSPEVTVVP